MTDIGVIGGAGYVGLVTSVAFAALGHKVMAMDLDKHRVALLSRGSSAVYEDGLEPILAELLRQDRITFTVDQNRTVQNCG